MTLHILGIAVEETDNQQPECKANIVDQFWLAAGDVLIEICQRQPDIRPMIDAAIDMGGDIEITAHNQGGKISFALAEPWVFVMFFSPMRVSCYSPVVIAAMWQSTTRSPSFGKHLVVALFNSPFRVKLK